MKVRAAMTRLARMDATEIAFRARTTLDTAADRVRYRLAKPAWNRDALARRLDPADRRVAEAARRLESGDHRGAHDIQREHFLCRQSTWPIGAARRTEFTTALLSVLPGAAADARARADGLLQGCYDLLGYRAVPYGRAPDWHADVVHGRRAPEAFGAKVPYLDPACGDHKVIWELNRHQYWRGLGREWWLNDDPACPALFVDQLTSWLRDNPPLHGVNWGSMLELAFRTMSWTWALEFFANTPPDVEAGRPWMVDLLLGIDTQLAVISRNLSRYFSPNTHLSGEALSLYAVSLAFPEFAASRARAALGREILLQESKRQILSDGGHAERSTHYHRYSTDFYLFATVVARRAEDPAAAAFTDASRAQGAYLRTMADESGLLQPIGDDDGGQLFGICGGRPNDVRTSLALAANVLDDPSLAISPPSEEVWWMLGAAPARRTDRGRPEPWPSRLLPESGYFVARQPSATMVFDVGPQGYLNGGHAHADALSVIANVAGRPLLVDPGTGTYTMDEGLRDGLRSSRLHNTVIVDDREHARPRGPFHWHATTDAHVTFAQTAEGCDAVQGFHDGYGDVRHARTCLALRDIGWLIVDQLIGSGVHRGDLYWHIHPDWVLETDADAIRLRGGDGSGAALAVTAGDVVISREGPLAAYAPEYGLVLTAPVVRASSSGPLPMTLATFIALPAAARGCIQLTVSPVHGRAPAGWMGSAVSVVCGAGRIEALIAAPEGPPRPWTKTRWGTQRLSTDGRAAVSVAAQERQLCQMVIEGSEAWADTEMAPAVHAGRG
jgi:hypothetical protein